MWYHQNIDFAFPLTFAAYYDHTEPVLEIDFAMLLTCHVPYKDTYM